jgi:hypothetical protein
MPQTYAQTHALNRHHAGRNPREHGAPLTAGQGEDATEHGNAAPRAGEISSTQEGGLAGGAKPGEKKQIPHPEQVEHSDSEKSKLPERGDENRKQAPNDRPGHKSGEGETPVG